MDAYPNNKFCQDLLKISETANSQGNDTAWGMGWNTGRRFQCIYRLIFWVDFGQESISVARQPLKLQTLVELHKAWRRRDVIGGLILIYQSHKPSVPILIATIVSLSKKSTFEMKRRTKKRSSSQGYLTIQQPLGSYSVSEGSSLMISPNKNRRDVKISIWFWACPSSKKLCLLPVSEEMQLVPTCWPESHGRTWTWTWLTISKPHPYVA